MTDSPLVSVVVPTRNNARTIRVCLASVRAQSYSRVELIVVDNHSEDETLDVATELADVAITGGPERSAQRNLGIDQAEGQWVLWLDSDMVLPPDSIEVALATALSTGAAGVALPERTVGDGFWTACRALERECYLNQPLLHNPRLVRRDYLLGEGAFHLAMSGPEDADLREQHEGAVGEQGRALLKSYAVNWRLLARDPVHAAGMVMLRSLEVAGYAAGARRARRDRAQ